MFYTSTKQIKLLKYQKLRIPLHQTQYINITFALKNSYGAPITATTDYIFQGLFNHVAFEVLSRNQVKIFC